MGVEASDGVLPVVHLLVVVHKSLENKLINSMKEVQVEIVREAQSIRSEMVTLKLESLCQETLEAAATRLQVLVW